MIKILTDKEAKLVLWKNGAGTTKELYRLADPDDNENFLLRISMATVTTSAPFSLFPGIDRILFLVSGKGMGLVFKSGKQILMDKLFEPIEFAGEEEVSCRLIQDECLDFNVMVQRHKGKAEVQICSGEEFKLLSFQESDQVFYYQITTDKIILIKYLPLQSHA